MTFTSPYHFRPMSDLNAEGRNVEMVLRDGRCVVGWLFCGMPSTPRSFWSKGNRGDEMVDAIGWREIEKDWSAFQKD
jgi:hypothetical protein